VVPALVRVAIAACTGRNGNRKEIDRRLTALFGGAFLQMPRQYLVISVGVLLHDA
jgi:hypothetical protein